MPKPLQEVRDLIRTLHYSFRTEETYANWIKQYILFHNKRHPAQLGRRRQPVPDLTRGRASRSCFNPESGAGRAPLFI